MISICRSASVDDLQEPELATLKARLTDALAFGQLGEKRLRATADHRRGKPATVASGVLVTSMCARTLRKLARCFAVSATLVMVLDTGRTCLGSGHGKPAKAAKAPAHGESGGGHGGHGRDQGGHGGHGGHGEEPSGVKSSGIELGQFKIRSDYPAEAQKSTVRFILYAAIKPELYDGDGKSRRAPPNEDPR